VNSSSFPDTPAASPSAELETTDTRILPFFHEAANVPVSMNPVIHLLFVASQNASGWQGPLEFI